MNQNNRPLGWTTLEEAQQLVKVGLPIETADMHYLKIIRENDVRYIPELLLDDNECDIPCWSLGALLELIPKIHESENDGGCYPTLCKRYDTDKWHCLYHRDTLYKTCQYDTAIEACIEMIIWLLKTNYYGRQSI